MVVAGVGHSCVGFRLGLASKLALGEMYGDCKAEINAEDGGEMRGELHGDDAIEILMNSWRLNLDSKEQCWLKFPYRSSLHFLS